MPISPAYNLATYRAYLLNQLEGQFRRGSSPSWSDSQILTYINDAIRQVYQRLTWLKSTPSAPVSLVSGTKRYPLPMGRLGVGVNTVTLTINGSTTPPLAQVDYTYQQTLVSNSQLAQNSPTLNIPFDQTLVGVPSRYYLDPSDQRYLIFIETPNVDGTINFVSQPSQPALTRMWDQQPVTAILTFGDPTIHLSDNTNLIHVNVGDQFGVYNTALQLDNATAPPLNPMPLEWYTIDAIDNAFITLNENYLGDESDAAHFITSQVPLFELAFPGLIGFHVCDLAFGIAMRTQDNNLSRRFIADAWEAIDRLSPNLENFYSGLPLQPAYLRNNFIR